jgi:hypothetical protein
MIYYLVTKQHAYTMTSFFSSWGKGLEKRITVVPYVNVLGGRQQQPGTYIFSDIERLGPLETWVLERMHTVISRVFGEERLLNHPTRSMRRYQLLRSLYDRGMNSFNIYRLKDRKRPERYPVFIRRENDHLGAITPLLYSEAHLSAVVGKLLTKKERIDDKVIVEFCNTADEDGIYRKYSAFMVGGVVVPRHLFFAKEWVLKGAKITSPSLLAEELLYLEQNPHDEQLKQVFQLAGINYGRIDYSLLDGRMQVWEINTNPMIASEVGSEIPERSVVHALFLDNFTSALQSIDPQ